MKDWIAVFAVALVMIVGAAAGLSGTLAFLLTFVIAWYLLTAREHGFANARRALGINFEPPLWTAANWRQLTALFDDDRKLIKSTAVALVTLSAALILGGSFAYAIAAIFAVLYASDIWRGGPPPRFARIPDASVGTAEPPAAPTRSEPSSGSSSGSTSGSGSGSAPSLRAAYRPLKQQKVRRAQPRLTSRRPRATTAATGKRRGRKPAKPSAWMLQPLPSRKPDTPMIALKPRKLVRPRPPQQRRLLRKPPLRVKPTVRRPASSK